MVNHIQIKDGKVYMADSTCENQDCVEQGTMTGENVDTRPMRNWIVCLPNGISIELRPGQRGDHVNRRGSHQRVPLADTHGPSHGGGRSAGLYRAPDPHARQHSRH